MPRPTRAEQLGAPAQAVTFLRQAIEVTTVEAIVPTCSSRRRRTPLVSGQLELAEASLIQAIELRERGGDGAAIAAAIRLRADGLITGRRREEGVRMFEAVIARFGDLGDDPRWVRVLASSARGNQLQGNYARARELADLAIERAERTALPDVAAQCLLVKGMTAFFQGRLWEGRAARARGGELAEQAGLSELAMRGAMTVAAITALDDPRDAGRLQREAIELSRRLGQRAMEINILGNVAEDARRTGDWDWIDRGARAGAALDLDTADASSSTLRSPGCSALRGTLSDEAWRDRPADRDAR